jgi:hypothetical protein
MNKEELFKRELCKVRKKNITPIIISHSKSNIEWMQENE